MGKLILGAELGYAIFKKHSLAFVADVEYADNHADAAIDDAVDDFCSNNFGRLDGTSIIEEDEIGDNSDNYDVDWSHDKQQRRNHVHGQ